MNAVISTLVVPIEDNKLSNINKNVKTEIK